MRIFKELTQDLGWRVVFFTYFLVELNVSSFDIIYIKELIKEMPVRWLMENKILKYD